MKKIISTFLFLFTLGATTSMVSAWVVPGSITKGAYTTSNTCNTVTNSYSPSGGFCAPGACTDIPGVWVNDGTSEVGNDGNCSWKGTSCTSWSPDKICCGSQGHQVGSGCKDNGGNNLIIIDPIYVQCSASTSCAPTTPVTTGTLKFKDYTGKNESPSYSMSNNFRKLAADLGETCNRWADGTDHTPPTKTGVLSCGSGNDTYYVGGANGSCDSVGKTDNCITSYDQFGAINRATTGCATPGSASAPTATCTVEGRQATPDDVGPSINIYNANVFTSDDNAWCNMNKYINASYGSTTPELTGCSYYKNLGSHTANPADKHPDLLENLSIDVNDVSGISEVRVELGNCDATYSLPTGISQILPNASSGIKPAYTSFTIPYNTSVTIDGTTLPSLRQKLTGSLTGRLDSCLLEGKNYLRVTAKDQARSDANAVTWSANTSSVDYDQQTKYLRVDNNGARLELTGLAKNIAESNITPALAPSCFIRWATIGGANQWKNFSILWNLKSGDPFGANVVDNCGTCTVLSSTNLNCSGKPAGSIWISPGGVDPNTGNFIGNTCDGLGPIPDTNSCQWGCSAGYSWNGSACIVPPPACTGALPANSIKTSTADLNQPYTYSANPIAACTFSCKPGSIWNAPNKTCDLVPVTCGSAENQTYASAAAVPPGNLCSDGFQPSISTVSPLLLWSCSATVSCSALLKGNAACGTANGSTNTIPPTNNLCADGSSPDVSGTGPWNWTCLGSNGGADASCSATKGFNYCTAGGTIPCVVMPAPVNGACNNATQFACTSGTSASNVANSCGQSATWSCNGSNGGSNASCSKANAACASWSCGSDITLSNGQVWQSCNLGSSVAGTGSASYGSFYQWGRNDTGWTAWWATDNWGEWWQGPCSVGYHVPKWDEWGAAISSITGKSTASYTEFQYGPADVYALQNTLKLPMTGYHNYVDNTLTDNAGFYWSSSTSWPTIWNGMYFYSASSSAINTQGSHMRAYWFQVRCIKNAPVSPVNGACNNAAQFACTSGTSASNVANSCGQSATWSCNGSNGGSNASCSKANAACTPPPVTCVTEDFFNAAWRNETPAVGIPVPFNATAQNACADFNYPSSYGYDLYPGSIWASNTCINGVKRRVTMVMDAQCWELTPWVSTVKNPSISRIVPGAMTTLLDMLTTFEAAHPDAEPADRMCVQYGWCG